MSKLYTKEANWITGVVAAIIIIAFVRPLADLVFPWLLAAIGVSALVGLVWWLWMATTLPRSAGRPLSAEEQAVADYYAAHPEKVTEETRKVRQAQLERARARMERLG